MRKFVAVLANFLEPASNRLPTSGSLMSKKFRFSDAKIRDLDIPEKGKRIHYLDDHSKGLELIVRATGTKSFYTSFWSPYLNKSIRVKIGNYPEANVVFARKENNKNVEQILRGNDPNQVKIERRNQLTFYELFNMVYDAYFVHLRSSINYKRNFNRNLKDFHKMYIDQITRIDIIKFHEALYRKRSSYTANRALELIRSTYNKAYDLGIEVRNPCERIKKKRELSRSRKLETSEIKKFFESVIKDNNRDVRDIVLLLLLTGARKTNVLEMKWKEINLSDKIWTIPITKNGTPQTVPLVDFAVKLLEERKLESKGEKFVFSSPASSKGHIVEIKRSWQRILERAELADFRLHDLRRSFASFQINAGSNMSVISKSLNHSSTQITQVYARLDLDPVRKSVENGVDYFLKKVSEG